MENLFKAKINKKFVLFQLKRNTKFMILAFTLMLAVYPLLVFTNYVLGDGTYNPDMFLVGRVLLTIILTISVFIVPFSLFSYLSSKRNLDVYHALPITRKDLYVSSLVSSLLIVLIPFTLVFTLGAVYNILAIPNVDGMLLINQYVYSVVLGSASIMPVLFALMNTGTLIDGLIYSAILHALPAIGYGAYILYGNALLVGFKASSDLVFLLFSTPIFTLFDLNFNVDRIYPNVWLVVVYWFLFTAVLSWIILQVYSLRKSEKAESPFTNRWFFPIVSTTFMLIFQVFFFSTFANLNDGRILDIRTLLFPVVFTFVGYMVLDVIANRGFRHFFKAALNFLIITAVTLLSFYGSIATNGFGYITRVPNAQSVESVEIEFSGGNPVLQLISSTSYNYLEENRSNRNRIVLTDDNQIEAIVNIHQKIIDEYRELGFPRYLSRYYNGEYPAMVEPEYERYGMFTVLYNMNNGSTISREYSIEGSWLNGLMDFIYTEEFFNYRYPMLNSKYFNEPSTTLFEFVDPFFLNEQRLSSVELTAFASAFKSDYLSKSNSAHIQTAPIKGFINLRLCKKDYNCGETSYPIREDDAKSIRFLEANNISFTPVFDEDTVHLIVESKNQLHSFFSAPSIHFDYGYNDVDKVNTFLINNEEVIELLPYLEFGSMYDQSINALKISPFNPKMEQFRSPSFFYGIQPEGEALLKQLKEGKEVIPRTLNSILFEEVDYVEVVE